jgi:hypothetical protein
VDPADGSKGRSLAGWGIARPGPVLGALAVTSDNDRYVVRGRRYRRVPLIAVDDRPPPIVGIPIVGIPIVGIAVVPPIVGHCATPSRNAWPPIALP